MSEYPINQRLRQFIKFKRLTVQKFESVCGFSNGYVNSIRKTPGADKLEAIVRVFPDLNREWLLTGEGEMLLSTPSAPVNWNTEAIPGISELIATVRKQADIIMSQQETINELTKRLARNPK